MGPRLRGPNKKKQADVLTKRLFDGAEELLDPAFEAQVTFQIKVGHLQMWDYGAVIALNLMGFAATSRRVTDMEAKWGKVDVRKALGTRFELSDTEIIDSIENRAVVVGASTAVATVEATRTLVRDMVILGGLSTQDVAESLSVTKGFPLWYSNKLARTEMHQSYELAQHQTYLRSGVKKHSWLTVGDRRVRPAHVLNEAFGTVEIGKPFPSGQIHPGDGPQSISCRCSVTPDLSDSAILLQPWDGRGGPILKISPIPTGMGGTASIPKSPPLKSLAPTRSVTSSGYSVKADALFDEKIVRAELARLDDLVGVHAEGAVRKIKLVNSSFVNEELGLVGESVSGEIRIATGRAAVVDGKVVRGIAERTAQPTVGSRVSGGGKVTRGDLHFVVDDSIQGTIRHEYGHEMAESIFFDTRKLNELDAMFARHRLAVSDYGATDAQEFFAESFSAWSHPKYVRGTLPKEIEDFLDTQFATARSVSPPLPKFTPIHPEAKDTFGQYRIGPELNDGLTVFRADRISLHDDAVRAMVGDSVAVEEPASLMLGGGSGSGKSTLFESGVVKRPTNAVWADADSARPFLPEFRAMQAAGDEAAANFTHSEVSHIASRAVSKGLSSGRNVVLDGTGNSTFAKLERRVKILRGDGRKVTAHYVTIDTDEAIRRAGVRAAGPQGRAVPDEIIRATHEGVSKVFPEALKKGLFDDAVLWDNTGKKPIKVLSYSNGKTTIHEPKLWDTFLRKNPDYIPPPRMPTSIEGLQHVKDLGGSTGATLVQDPLTGKKFVMKRGASAEHLREEFAAEKAYRSLGVAVPESTLIETSTGPVKLAEFLDDAVPLGDLTGAARAAAIREAEKDFAVDALLANWDVMGMSADNILVDASGKVWRVDVGAALRFRAQGALKGSAFNEFPLEFWSLTKQGSTSRILGGMTYERKLESLEKLITIRKGLGGTSQVFKDLFPKEIQDIMFARYEHLRKTAMYSKEFLADKWLASYVDDVMRHRLQMAKVGVFDKLPTELFQVKPLPMPSGGSLAERAKVKKLNEQLQAGASKRSTGLYDKDGNLFGGIRGAYEKKDSVSQRFFTYLDDFGGSSGVVEEWASAQGGTTFSTPSKAYKKFIVNNRKPPPNQYFWRKGGSAKNKAGWESAELELRDAIQEAGGALIYQETMAANHAMSFQTLKTVKFFNNGSKKLRVIRTVNEPRLLEQVGKTKVKIKLDSAGKPLLNFEGKQIIDKDAVHKMRMAAFDSTSAFDSVEVSGSMLTIREVPHTRVVGNYFMDRPDRSSFFYRDHENEFVAILDGIPFKVVDKLPW